MKVGALALLRNKCRVCVRTSCDTWSFGLKKHSLLQEEVLTVFVSGEMVIVVNIIRSDCSISDCGLTTTLYYRPC